MYKISYKKRSNVELPIDSLATRYKRLIDEDEKQQLIYVKQVFDNSTFRYRAYNIQQALEQSEKYSVHYILNSEIEKILPSLDNKKVGIVVFQRAFWDDNVQMLLDWCGVNDVPTAFDMDDFVFEPNCIPELFYAMNWKTDMYDGSTLREISHQSALHDIVASQCKYLIATNDYLALKLKTFFKKETFVIPNFLNHEQVSSSRDAVTKKTKRDGNFTVGYFSGSASHQKDFQTISSELAAVLRANDKANLKVVGYLSLDSNLEGLKDKISFTYPVSYTDLQYEIASVDVNIVPLFNSVFTNCKSDLKYFEAAIVKTPTIASPVFAYTQSIKSGVNGFLCKNGEWQSTIQSLIDNPTLLSTVAEKGLADSKKYYADEQLDLIEGVFDKITN